jgi:serine/threonine protein phosphatase PrpC
LNAAVLEMFRNEYIGTAPYVSCFPSVRHRRLCPRDQFLILSSDGLYQYLNNEEVVSQVESFMEKFPEGDPAQHLIEELLLRAAKKAGKWIYSPFVSFFICSFVRHIQFVECHKWREY